MKFFELVRLIRKHLVILVLTPLLLALLVAYLTRKPSYTFSSETMLYTGIASGGSVEMDKSFSFFANNTAFDNLINVIKSRETQQEVGIRLLAQNLMLPGYDPKYISKASYEGLMRMTPNYILDLVKHAKKDPGTVLVSKPLHAPEATTPSKAIYHTVVAGDTPASIAREYGISVETLKQVNEIEDEDLETGQVLIVGYKDGNDPSAAGKFRDSTARYVPKADTFTFTNIDTTGRTRYRPPMIDPIEFEKVVEALKKVMASSDTNFIYKLLNFNHPHYSIKAISSVEAQRIASSDLVKLKYTSNDPGICQQTLVFFTEVCIKNYKEIKENRSDAVVKYFEYQVSQASNRLKAAEDKLLKFNEDNKIINYYEQSKAVAVVKEDIEVDYYNKRIKLAGAEAALKRIEDKLSVQQQIQLKSTNIVDKRNQLAVLNTKISSIETYQQGTPVNNQELAKLKNQAADLKDEIKAEVNALYGYGNSPEGLPVSSLLNEWINNVITYEETKAGLEVLGERISDFQKQYAIYAPAGANLKRIEREISVSEQEFLELLHGLNLAKLKMQDAELAANIKPVDFPYYPLSPNPTKRKIMVIAAALLGFLIVFGTILAMEYFDNSLRNLDRASRYLKLSPLGLFPKVLLRTGKLNFLFVANRLLEMVVQHIGPKNLSEQPVGQPRTILFFSTQSNEGKTVTCGNIARKLKLQGKKVLVLNFSRESLQQFETSQLGYTGSPPRKSTSGVHRKRKRFSLLHFLLGYQDMRIDYDSPFLQDPSEYLSKEETLYYSVNSDYFSVKDYSDLLRINSFEMKDRPDYVLIELPPILYYSYPNELVSSADLAVLVCRANRIWQEADGTALRNVSEFLSSEPKFFLNGVNLNEVESLFGDLPKHRSKISRVLRNLVRFQFYNRATP